MKECLPNLEESKKEIMIVSFCLGDLPKAKNRFFQSKSYILTYNINFIDYQYQNKYNLFLIRKNNTSWISGRCLINVWNVFAIPYFSLFVSGKQNSHLGFIYLLISSICFLSIAEVNKISSKTMHVEDFSSYIVFAILPSDSYKITMQFYSICNLQFQFAIPECIN